MTRGILLKGFAISLILVASAAVAASRSIIRDLVLPKGPEDKALVVHVAGGVATVLRFEKPCDPERTKLLGWEGRFEPLLVGGKKVVLEPLRSLADGESFLLLVTLVDGTEVPFTVVGGAGEVDHQVSIYPDPDTEGALLASLSQARGRERRYREEAERYREEKTSVDHALAALMANNAMELTPFRRDRIWKFPGDEAQIEVWTYTSPTKTAVRFHVTNQDPVKSWKLQEARLGTVSSSEARPFALRTTQDEIAPGATGYIAVVFDDSAFASKAEKNGFEQLVLELFRSDGRQEVYVLLEVEPQRPRK